MTPLTISEQAIRQQIQKVISRVCEYDDRTSPDDFPEALLITPDEMESELRQFAEAILALASPPEPTAGGGWKLVPVEPTAAMYLAGWRQANKEGPNVLGVITDTAAGQIYRAMLAASPSPDALKEEG